MADKVSLYRGLRNFLGGVTRSLTGSRKSLVAHNCDRDSLTLAIAAKTFDAPTQTFIRDHVHNIAPGSTVLICKKKGDVRALGCPYLSGVAEGSTRINWRPVREFLHRHRVTVLLAEFADTGFQFIDVCNKANVKLYVHVHGFDVSKYLREPDRRSAYRRLFKHASGIVAPSRFLANMLAGAGCPHEKLHISPNGVDPRRFQPADGVPLRLLAVGRFVEKKAPHLTIEAFAGVVARFPDARLDMIGTGPLARRCLALIREIGLEDKIRLLGELSSEQVANAMREASLFVQHSVTDAEGNTEGLPVVILEAMASALPVVATRHNGIPEIVIEGETGLLVEERDVPGMTQAIVSLLADPARAKTMGEAGRRRVLTHFTQEQTRDRLRAIMGLSILTNQARSPQSRVAL